MGPYLSYVDLVDVRTEPVNPYVVPLGDLAESEQASVEPLDLWSQSLDSVAPERGYFEGQ